MSLSYLLDTNICIYIAKQKPQSVAEKFEQMVVGSTGMSVVTYGELLYGANKSSHPKKTTQFLKELESFIPALPMPTQAAQHYGAIRSHLEKKGMPVGNNDLWIAAHALALDLVLVTNNTKEFKRIPKLQLENWVN